MASLWFSTPAQEAAPQSENASTGTISGRVVTEAGQPLANATVFFQGASRQRPGQSTTTTDTDGNFQLRNLDAGLYSVWAGLSTYVTPPRDPDAPITYYRVGDTVRLELIKGGVVTGSVVNAAGEPVIGLPVRAIMVRDANGKTGNGVFSMGERATDDRGIYRIYGLTPGGYIVQAGTGRNQYSATPYDFDAPTFSPSSNRDTAAEVPVRSGEETTADIRYRAEPGHVVSGTVKLRGPNAANVSLTPAGGGVVPMSSYQTLGTRGFSFSGIGDGEYDVVAQEVMSSQIQASLDLALSEKRRIIVKGSDVTGLELITMPLAAINGKFVLEQLLPKPPECQNKRRPAFTETLIGLTRNKKEDAKGENWLNLRLFAANAFPDQDGSFVLRNVRPGKYSFAPRFFARYWYLQSMTIGAASGTKPATPRVDAARNWTAVKNGDNLTGLTITLSEGAASIRGKLSLPEGKQTPADLKIYVVPAEREKADDPLRFFFAAPEGDGAFFITNLPPGQYFILAQSPGDKDPQTLDNLRLPNAADERLKLRRAAEAAKLNIELKPCQNLTDYQLPLTAVPK